jgi:hypothetical protein
VASASYKPQRMREGCFGGRVVPLIELISGSKPVGSSGRKDSPHQRGLGQL